MQSERFEVRTADGRRLEALVAGPPDGELVVLHHGTPGSAAAIWPPHLERAARRGLRLAEYTRPGGPGSDRDPGRSTADCAADAAAVADALGAERFLTLGGSGGGPHALACAALLKDRVRAAASVAGVAPVGGEQLDWLAGMGQENVDEFAAMRDGAAALEAFLRELEPELSSLTAAKVLEAFGDLVSDADARALSGEYAEFSAAGMRHALSAGIWGWFDDDMTLMRDWGFELGAIEVPVSIWHGREDRFVPPAHGEWLAAHVPGARAHLLDGEGHVSLALARFGDVLDELCELGGVETGAQSST